MYNNALEILKILNKNKFEAYIIGGYPRDLYLGNKSTDIDICTNAKYKDLKKIFKEIKDNKYGSYKLKYKNQEYEITTYRKESKYLNNRFPKTKYTKKLTKDLKRRDFIINTLCIDRYGSYIDLKNAKKDLDEKIIRLIGPKTKIKEDALRILRAIRFATLLNFRIDKKLDQAIEKYKELGAIFEETSLDVANYALATYYIIACAEASSNLGRFDGIRYGYRSKNYETLKELFVNSRSEGFGSEVKRRIILGTYALSSGYYDAYYKKAQKVRTLVKNEFAKAFEKYDVLLTPTSPVTAFKIGEKTENPLEMYLSDICTVSVNIAGLPGISIPCGVDSEGMPIGMQLIGKHFDEETILNAAYTYEQATNFRKKYRPEFK